MASLSDQHLRNYLKETYPNSSFWHRKVDSMSKAQVFAIYMRFEEQKETEEQQETYVQATLF